MGDYPTLGQKKTPFLGSGVGSGREWLVVEKDQAMLDGHTYEPGQVVHVQLGRQVGFDVVFDKLEHLCYTYVQEDDEQ